MLLYPTKTVLEGPNVYQHFKFFTEVVRHYHSSFTVVSCQHVVVILDAANYFVVTTFPSP